MESTYKTKPVEMPEGPESHTIADKLRSHILGLYLVEVEVETLSLQDGFGDIRLPLKVREVGARGKRVLFLMECGTFVTFLGMTGRWALSHEDGTLYHLKFTFLPSADSGFEDGSVVLYYFDTRRFGKVSYYLNEKDLQTYMSSIGRDMLSEPPIFEEYLHTLRTVAERQYQKKIKIMDLSGWLLEQKYFSGVGNYLKSEILYFARLDPRRLITSLSDGEIERIYSCTLAVMGESYKHGGLTISDYWSPDGDAGTYPRIVYMRDGKKDPHGFEIKSFKDSDGRTTFWVPELQN